MDYNFGAPNQAPLPLTQRMEELSLEDLALVESKIRPLKMAPMVIRIGMPVFLLVVAGIFHLMGGLSWVFGLFVLGAIGIMVLAEFTLSNYLKRLKADVLNRQKRIWSGTLLNSWQRGNSNRSDVGVQDGYVWQVSGREFSIKEKRDFDLADVGDQVEIEQLPESDLILRIRKIDPEVW